MLFADKLHDIIDTLENDKVLLAPVEFAWAITFKINEHNLKTLPLEPRSFLDNILYIMAKDIASVKKLAPNLHPRIETLLHYHRRPLGVKLELAHLGYEPAVPVACCLAFDPYIRKVIELLDSPVACIYITNGNNRLITSHNKIPTEVMKKASYVAKHRRNENLAGVKPIAVTYDDDGNLEFD